MPKKEDRVRVEAARPAKQTPGLVTLGCESKTLEAYPTLSRKHGELVCTAGVREDGSGVRLYPIPFRLLDYKDRYQKFDWIETRLVRNFA